VKNKPAADPGIRALKEKVFVTILSVVRTSEFDYELPEELIAQHPVPQRDQSRLLVLERRTGRIEHCSFHELPRFLGSNDLLVLNDSRVIPARLRGLNAQTGGRFEILLLKEIDVNNWWVMMRPGKRARPGTKIGLEDCAGTLSEVEATVVETNPEGQRRLVFRGTKNIKEMLDLLGDVPLPPYIERHGREDIAEDRERYQTVFARQPGSVAAPTAGLHFTLPLLQELRSRGVEICYVTLHVGSGTFAPVKSETIAGHEMHEETYRLGQETALLINETKQRKGRVVAVGTTALRVLETAAAQAKAGRPESSSDRDRVAAGEGRTNLFIYPPREFRIVDALLTNFHLPRSTLLMLVSAFAAPGLTRGLDLVLSAYAEAIRERYRFFSYGDAMLIL
jgi:S-adenosylmethionine:tRNA ribosyltransferase-isomerase